MDPATVDFVGTTAYSKKTKSWPSLKSLIYPDYVALASHYDTTPQAIFEGGVNYGKKQGKVFYEGFKSLEEDFPRIKLFCVAEYGVSRSGTLVIGPEHRHIVKQAISSNYFQGA